MNKQNTKVSAEFLRSLKNTSQLPLKINKTKLKDNQMPQSTKDLSNSKRNGRVVEDDFRKIAQIYVVQGDVLKKYQINNQNHFPHNPSMPITTPKQSYEKDQEIMTLKEKVKLQYLQKKGFLTPEEQNRLKKVRGSQHQSSHLITKQSSQYPCSKGPQHNLISPYHQPLHQHYHEDYPTNLPNNEGLSGYYPPNKHYGKNMMDQYSQRHPKQYSNNNSAGFKYY